MSSQRETRARSNLYLVRVKRKHLTRHPSMKANQQATQTKTPAATIRNGAFFVIIVIAIFTAAYQNDRRSDTVQYSSDNPSKSYRASILQRRTWSHGNVAVGTTFLFVLLNKENRDHRLDDPPDAWATVVLLKASQPADIVLLWQDDDTLKISCEHCKVKYRQLSRHLTQVGPIRVVYEGFKVV